jgi:hypothetical protein
VITCALQKLKAAITCGKSVNDKRLKTEHSGKCCDLEVAVTEAFKVLYSEELRWRKPASYYLDTAQQLQSDFKQNRTLKHIK